MQTTLTHLKPIEEISQAEDIYNELLIKTLYSKNCLYISLANYLQLSQKEVLSTIKKIETIVHLDLYGIDETEFNKESIKKEIDILSKETVINSEQKELLNDLFNEIFIDLYRTKTRSKGNTNRIKNLAEQIKGLILQIN